MSVLTESGLPVTGSLIVLLGVLWWAGGHARRAADRRAGLVRGPSEWRRAVDALTRMHRGGRR